MSSETNGYVGTPVLRREDDRLLRGRAVFIDDLPEPADTLYLAFLRSPYPHARITSIDVSAAKAAPGVVEVYTGDFIASRTKPIETPTLKDRPKMVRPNIAIDVVRYAGEAVAVVVADDPYRAEDAIELIDVDYDPLPAIVTVEEALAPGATRVHDYLPDNLVFNMKYAVAGTDEAFAGARHVISGRFDTERVSAVAMETRGFLTRFDAGTNKLQHHATAHMPHKMRWELADTLGLQEKEVQIVVPHVGGSFGMKTVTYSEDFVGAVISRELNRPIKWLQDRQDDLTVMHGRDFHLDVDMAFDEDGHILAVRNRAVVDLGAYPLWIATAGIDSAGAGHHMMGPYRCKHYAYDCSTVVTNKAPISSYRGVAAPACFFATETLMERMAARLGISPIEMRRRNLISPADLPYKNAVGIEMDTATHEECMDRALALVGYDEFKRKHTGELEADGKYRGIGVAVVTDHTGQGTSITRSRGQASRWPGFEGCSVRMEPDGKVIAYISFAGQGQGHTTVFAQLLADELGMPIENVLVEQGDTATMPFGTGNGASRGAVVGGGAVMKAGAKVAQKIKRIGAHLLEVSADDVVLAGGKVAVKGVSDLSVDIATIAATAYMIGPRNMPEGESIGLDATEYFDPPTSVYSNATHAACVAVDAGTGRVTIERYVVVHDCGRVLNPLILDGQVTGAIIQGIGSVLTERMRFSEDGQPQTTTLLDYAIPTFLDVPKIEIDHVVSLTKHNPGGIKGAGEGGVVGAVPAIVLALTDALKRFDAKFNVVPIMPDQLLEIMHPAPAEEA